MENLWFERAQAVAEGRVSGADAAYDADPLVRWCAAGSQTLDAAGALSLAGDEEPLVRARLAERGDLDGQVVELLADDRDDGVLRALAECRSLDGETGRAIAGRTHDPAVLEALGYSRAAALAGRVGGVLRQGSERKRRWFR